MNETIEHQNGFSRPTPIQHGFTASNRYFGFRVHTWNLPSGYTCPGALECLAFANRATGKITNGKQQTFRCYSATMERYPAVREKSWANLEIVRGRTADEIAAIISAALPKRATHVRIHAGGDFFSQDYFDGWLQVASGFPAVKFWAFTKSLPFWLARRDKIPSNLCLQASYGGKHDDLIAINGLKFAKVVFAQREAANLNLEIDTDDALAMEGDQSFALLENSTRKKSNLSSE
jgi:hypothetical protein